LQYRVYIRAFSSSVTVDEIPYCGMKQSTVETQIDGNCKYEHRKVYCLVGKNYLNSTLHSKWITVLC